MTYMFVVSKCAFETSDRSWLEMQRLRSQTRSSKSESAF